MGMRFIRLLRDLLFVPRCAGCGQRLAPGSPILCDTCALRYALAKDEICLACGHRISSCSCSGTALKTHGVKKLYKLFRYHPRDTESVQNRMLYLLKHRAVRDVVSFFATELAERLDDKAFGDKTALLITYAPRSRAAVKRWGFDHMELLARALAEELGAEFAPLLARRKGREQKKRHGIGARYANMKDAFTYVGGASLEGRRIVLLDDISTSGATLASAAKLIRSHGGRRIVFLVLGVTVRER